MDENKSYSDIASELQEDDALEEELLSVEKKETKIRHIGMKRSILIVAIAIVLIALIIAGYMIFGKKKPENTGDPNVKVLFNYEKTNITKIELDNRLKGEKMVLTSFMNGTTQEWNIEGQRFDDINQNSLRSLVQYASYLESKYVLEYKAEKLGEYTLDQPNAVVKVTYNDGNVITFDVGGEYGSSAGTYIRIHGIDEIYVVTDYVRIAYTAERSNYLKLPSLSRTGLGAQIVSIIDKNRITTSLAYIPDAIYGTDAWQLVQPTNASTNSTAVDELFVNIDSFSLTSVYNDKVGENITKYGFDKPTLELQSFDRENKLLDHLIIGKEAEEMENTYYCVILGDGEKLSDAQVYLVKKDQMQLLAANPAVLASPYLLALNINWLRSGKITVDGTEYVITIDRKLRYGEDGKVLYNEDGSENTTNTYYINGIKLDETQFKYFYSTFLFLQIEGTVSPEQEKGESLWKYELDVVIPVTGSDGVKINREEKYTGDYLKVSDNYAVLDSNQSINAVFTVRIQSLERLRTALGLLLEGRMPTT